MSECDRAGPAPLIKSAAGAGIKREKWYELLFEAMQKHI